MQIYAMKGADFMGIGEIAAYALAAIIMLILCRIFIKPLKTVLILILNSVLGGIGLYIFNLIFASIGFSIGINPVTAAVCGMLGLPGLVLLILVKLLFGI